MEPIRPPPLTWSSVYLTLEARIRLGFAPALLDRAAFFLRQAQGGRESRRVRWEKRAGSG